MPNFKFRLMLFFVINTVLHCCSFHSSRWSSLRGKPLPECPAGQADSDHPSRPSADQCPAEASPRPCTGFFKRNESISKPPHPFCWPPGFSHPSPYIQWAHGIPFEFQQLLPALLRPRVFDRPTPFRPLPTAAGPVGKRTDSREHAHPQSHVQWSHFKRPAVPPGLEPRAALHLGESRHV